MGVGSLSREGEGVRVVGSEEGPACFSPSAGLAAACAVTLSGLGPCATEIRPPARPTSTVGGLQRARLLQQGLTRQRRQATTRSRRGLMSGGERTGRRRLNETARQRQDQDGHWDPESPSGACAWGSRGPRTTRAREGCVYGGEGERARCFGDRVSCDETDARGAVAARGREEGRPTGVELVAGR